ncbi:MAG: dihydropyrimidinase [Clostridiales bacterium]|nr:dihydropyrimidinase [Clostridiales bacterium]
MTIIKNGNLVAEDKVIREDLAVSEGKIARIAPSIEPGPGDQVIDAAGFMVFPGFIDAHTHLDMDNGVTVTADDFASGTLAALLGGTTSIIDFATQARGESLAKTLDKWHAQADGHCLCHYGCHMSITDWNQSVKAELPAMFGAGISSFKVYLSYDHLRVRDRDLFELLLELRRLGGLVGVHCENGDLVNAGIQQQKELGHLEPIAHALSRPPLVEAEAVHRLLAIAKFAGCAVNVVHLSSGLGMEEIRRARAAGQKVLAETCPQYLLLEDSCYKDPETGRNFVCSPPIRPEADRVALTEAVKSGEIDTVSTDHCSYTLAQKAMGREDFSRIPNGLPGIEQRPAAILGTFWGELSAPALARLLAGNAARLYGMYPEKGVIREGSDADLVLYDPGARTVISAKTQHMKADYTPYEGMTLKGAVRDVLLMGDHVVQKGRLAKAPKGCYLLRKAVDVSL